MYIYIYIYIDSGWPRTPTRFMRDETYPNFADKPDGLADPEENQINADWKDNCLVHEKISL